MPEKISMKWVLFFVVPVVVLLLIAYVHLRTLNRSLEARLYASEDEKQIYSGEVYRLRQLVEEREARIKFLSNPDLERSLISLEDGYIWLFVNPSSGDWYADTENSPSILDGEDYRLIVGGNEVGSFIPQLNAVGLQKIGNSLNQGSIEILAAPLGESWKQNSRLVYSDAAPD
jgi:hypothetical protein